MAKPKHPKTKDSVKSPEVRTSGDLDAWKPNKIVILLSTFDLDGPWGLLALRECNNWRKVLITIEQYQTMTWSELLKAVGSVKSGTNHHEIEVVNLSKKAKNRMNEIPLEEDTGILVPRRRAPTFIRHTRWGSMQNCVA